MCRIMHLLNLHAYSHIFECLLGCLIRLSHNLEVTVHNFQESGLKFQESESLPNNNNIGVSLSQAITLFLIVSSPEWRKALGRNRKGWRLITLFSLLYYNPFERIPGWCLQIYRVSDSQNFKEPQMLFLIGTQCSSSLGETSIFQGFCCFLTLQTIQVT